MLCCNGLHVAKHVELQNIGTPFNRVSSTLIFYFFHIRLILPFLCSQESWQDPKAKDTGAVINILDIGRQNFANGGVVSRYLCDLAQCCNLPTYEYKDVVPNVSFHKTSSLKIHVVQTSVMNNVTRILRVDCTRRQHVTVRLSR